LSDHLRAHDAALARLQALHPKLIDLSLDRMLRLCAALDRPQDRLPPVIHVAGTNGKGSTVAYLRAMAEAAGLKVHVFTSPHLVRFAERIRLAGTLITDDHLADVLDRVEQANAGLPITFFEITTAAAFVAFAEVPGRPVHRRGRAGRHAGRHQCRDAEGQRHRPGRHRSPRVPGRHASPRSRSRRPGSSSPAPPWSRPASRKRPRR
jgi:UDP-N-acetylmuramyl tripeptide synthase